MLGDITANHTYLALLIVQALHLLHHRVVKRHISYAEVVSGTILCFHPSIISLPDVVYISAHLLLSAIQIVGSIWINKLSPDWKAGNN